MPGTVVRTPIGLAIPSSISRDLRAPSPRASVVEHDAASSPLLLPLADGALSKICGSLIEPEDKRQRWACHGCACVFARDATIYMTPLRSTTMASQVPAPLHTASQSALNRSSAMESSTSTQQEHFCKACYTERFTLGECFACTKPVIGSTKEDGKYVKAGSGTDMHIWHGRCWRCTTCGAVDAESDISLGLEGVPVCAPCFDRPRPRKHVVANPPSLPFSNSGSTSNRRVSPPAATAVASSLSGSSTRQGMGAAIAELSRKFGQSGATASRECQISNNVKQASPVLPPQSERSSSPTRNGLTRSNSITNGIRPLTAQFSGQSFNLAAFRPTTPTTMVRSDSRSRSGSPTKELQLQDEVCAKCFKGPFEAPSITAGNGELTREARMISLHSGAVYYHSECFCCAICEKSMENATLSFVRLDEGRFAHPACAPPATIMRKTTIAMPNSPGKSRPAASQYEHATHQRIPRPSSANEVATHNLPTSYLTGRSSGGTSVGVTTPTSSLSTVNRRFQPSSGAAPPTRSTLLHQRPMPGNQAMHANASMAVSSSASASRMRHMSAGPGGASSADAANAAAATRFARLGGMHLCGGCDKTVSSLEGTPGPRGQTWHRKCLVCNAPPSAAALSATSMRLAQPSTRCGKQLDSSAKVNADGQLRCRACYDKENARHRVV